MRFEIKCDNCKKTIGKTDNMMESYAGGKCKSCKEHSQKYGYEF